VTLEDPTRYKPKVAVSAGDTFAGVGPQPATGRGCPSGDTRHPPITSGRVSRSACDLWKGGGEGGARMFANFHLARSPEAAAFGPLQELITYQLYQIGPLTR